MSNSYMLVGLPPILIALVMISVISRIHLRVTDGS